MQEKISHIFSSYIYACSTRKTAIHKSFQTGSVFYYNFDQECHNPSDLCAGHACHGCEVSYIFGDEKNFKETSDFMTEMQFYWASFAKYGTPNTFSPYPDWMVYDSSWSGEKDTLWLRNASVRSVADPDSTNTDNCDFWDSLNIYLKF